MKRGEVKKGSAWALVTGAGSGIGRGYANRLAKLGYNVILVGNNRAPLEQVQKEIETTATGIEVRTLSIDLARMEAADELYDTVKSWGIEIEVLINNAGIFSFCDILNTPIERIERMTLLHDMTLAKNCRRFGKDMVARGRGYILNMSSYSVWMPWPGMALYTATKAYVRSFTKAFSREMRPQGVRVTAVCPAGVATDLYGLSSRWQKIGRRLGVLISPDSCARRGLQALWRGKKCIVPDWWNRLWIPLCMAVPMWMLQPIRKFTMKFQK